MSSIWQDFKRRTIAIPLPRLEVAGLGLYLRQIAAIVAKDVRAEVRRREALTGMLMFGLLVLVVFNFAFDPQGDMPIRATAGMLWVAIAFAAMLGLGHVFAQEREHGGLEGLVLCPADPAAVYLGKFAGALLLTLAMELVIVPLFAVFSNLSILSPGLILSVLLGSVGLVAAGTLISAMAESTRSREMMLPLLLLPVLAPLFVAGVEGTSAALEGDPWSDLTWLALLGAFDIVYIVVCPLLFEYVVEEMLP